MNFFLKDKQKNEKNEKQKLKTHKHQQQIVNYECGSIYI